MASFALDFHASDFFSAPFLGSVAVLFAVFVYVISRSRPATKILDPVKWQSFPLIKKTQVSPNSAIYRFALPTSTSILGLPIGHNISVSAEINGKDVMRSYSPISSDDDAGHFDLLVKTYEMGNISRVFSTLQIGETIKVKGPKGKFNYAPDFTKSIGMIAGGTGLSPMMQIIRRVLKNPNDSTRLSLIFANRNEDDILLREELDALAAGSKGQFKVYYVLEDPPQRWTGGAGFVSKDMIQEHLPEAGPSCKVLLCGPPPMITAMKKHLEQLKFSSSSTASKSVEQIFVF